MVADAQLPFENNLTLLEAFCAKLILIAFFPLHIKQSTKTILEFVSLTSCEYLSCATSTMGFMKGAA